MFAVAVGNTVDNANATMVSDLHRQGRFRTSSAFGSDSSLDATEGFLHMLEKLQVKCALFLFALFNFGKEWQLRSYTL